MPSECRVTAKKTSNWATQLVRECFQGSAWGVLGASMSEFLFRIGLIDPTGRPAVDFIITSAVVSVIGACSVTVLYLCIREELDVDSDDCV